MDIRKIEVDENHYYSGYFRSHPFGPDTLSKQRGILGIVTNNIRNMWVIDLKHGVLLGIFDPKDFLFKGEYIFEVETSFELTEDGPDNFTCYEVLC